MHLNYRKVCKITTSPPASLLIKGQGTEQTSVKYYEMAYWAYLAPPPSPQKTKQNKKAAAVKKTRANKEDRFDQWQSGKLGTGSRV